MATPTSGPARRRTHRLLLASALWLTTLSLLLVLSPREAEAAPPDRATGWSWPLDPLPEVLRPFDPPESAYGPGHRGIDLAAEPGQRVAAVADGVVTHSGVVAGRGTVTVLHAGGVASTYEPLTERIATGRVLTRGEAIGALADGGPAGAGRHCAPMSCLHLGARLDGAYLDPMLLLGRVRIILLPLRD